MALPTIDQFADQIHDASLVYQSLRAQLPAGLYRFDDLPDETTQAKAAKTVVREIGHRIYAAGGDEMMVNVYDRATQRFGYRGVRGISGLWTGIGGWQA